MRSPLAFPLLGKELRELAARPRTYVVRVLLALALLGGFLIGLGTLLAETRRTIDLIGQGDALLEPLVWPLALAVVMLAPATSAMSIAGERERGSLVALLLTPMRPWDLVLQKWLSRQITLLPLIVLALPLLAICYAFGGIDAMTIELIAYTLLLAAVQFGALGIAVGAWCRTASGAALCSYLALIALIAAGPLICAIAGIDQRLVHASWIPVRGGCTIDPFGVLRLAFVGNGRWSHPDLLRWSWPALLSIPLMLACARMGILRRLEPRGGGVLLRAFLSLDRWYARAEARLGRRVPRELPGDAPVAWREINRRALANPRYLTRLFLPLAAATLGLCTLIGCRAHGDAAGSYALMVDGMITLGSLAMLALALPMVDGERSAQTLEVLLTTPLRGRDILAQKQRALLRMQALVTLLPLLAIAWQAYAAIDWQDREISLAIEVGCAVLLPATAGALGAAVGLAVRRRGRAAALLGVMVAAWLTLPLLVNPVASALGATWAMDRPAASSYSWAAPTGLSPAIARPIAALSPLGLLRLVEDEREGWWSYRMSPPTRWWQVIAVGLGGQSAVWLAARLWVRWRADALLRRGAASA